MMRYLSFVAIALFGMASSTQAAVVLYDVNLSGPNESPPNASPGFGIGQVTIDTILNTMRVQVSFSGLTGTTTASHIHSATLVPLTGTAGVATSTPSFVGFPLGVTSGSMDQTYDMTLSSSYNAAFITANGGTPASAESALFSSFAAGTAYLNIHTSTFGSGEIRGFLTPSAIPEPGSLSLAVLAAVGGFYGWSVQRRKKSAVVVPA